MRIRPPFVILLAAGVLGAALPAVARPAAPAARVEYAGRGVVRGDLGAATSTDPRAAADAALRAWASRLGVDPGAFRLTDVRRSVLGVHVRGREYRDGVPVLGSSVAVHLVDGAVWQVEARPSALPGTAVARPVGAARARTAALAHLGVTSAVRVSTDRVLAPVAGRLTDVWRVPVLSLAPPVAATVLVSAADGRVVAVTDGKQYVDGNARIFDPSPMVTTRNPKLRQPGEVGLSADADLDSAELTAARRDVPLRDLDATALAQGRLVGPWANVIAGGYFAVGQPNFDVTRGDPRFEGLMAYAHVDRIQRYFQALGFRGGASVNAEPQDVVTPRAEGFDNSFYQPGNDLMLLGTGGVDDGEDAEVIIHEYGHAVQDAQVRGWGDTNEGGAMGEGFGDFLAAAYYARVSNGFQDECVAEWDATTYSDANPPCLRRTDSKKRYPDDVENQVHADGEMWSAFLWRLRAKLGRTTAERSDNAIRLVLASHELLSTTAEFGDGVAALRTAARAMRKGTWVAYIEQTAKASGLPLN